MSKRQHEAEVNSEAGPAKKARFESPFEGFSNSGPFEFTNSGVPKLLPLPSINTSFTGNSLFSSKVPDVIVTETRHNFVLNPNFFLVTKTAKFGVEREKLIIHSVVWASHLKDDTKSAEIELEGFKDDVLEEVCKFMYTPIWSGPFQPKNVTDYEAMVPLAHKYEMRALMDFCEQGLLKMRPLTAQTLRFAETYHLKTLRKETICHLARTEVFDSDTLTECTHQTLLELLTVQHDLWNKEFTVVKMIKSKLENANSSYSRQEAVEYIRKFIQENHLELGLFNLAF